VTDPKGNNMTKFLTAIGGIVVVVLAWAGLAALGAYPTKWVVNYLFNPDLLSIFFTTGHFDVWHAFCLNYIAGTLLRSGVTTVKG